MQENCAPWWGDSHLRALQMGAPGLWQMVTGLNVASKGQEQPVGQPAVMALSAVPCWEHWFCPEQGRSGREAGKAGAEASLVGRRNGSGGLLGAAGMCTGMCVTTFDTSRPQRADSYISCIKFRLHTLELWPSSPTGFSP